MENTLHGNRRELGEQKKNGKHSKHHAQTDTRKEKRNGGHFLEKQKGIAGQSQGGKETHRERRTLSRETKGDWGSKRGMEDTLNIMRRRTRGRKRGMEDTF